MIVCYFAKSEFNQVDFENIQGLIKMYDGVKLYIDSLTTVNVPDITFERLPNWREVESRNNIMIRLDQHISSAKTEEYQRLLLDSFRYELILRSNLALYIFELYSRFILSGNKKLFVIFLDTENVLSLLNVFSNFDSRLIFYGRQKKNAFYTLLKGISFDLKFLFSFLDLKQPRNRSMPATLVVEAFNKNKRFFDSLLSYLKASKQKINIIYPLREYQKKPDSEHSVFQFSKLQVIVSCILILPFHRIQVWLKKKNTYSTFVQALVYSNHNMSLVEVATLLLFRKLNQHMLNQTKVIITTSNASSFVRAFVFAFPDIRSITVQHGHMTFFEYEHNILCKEFWVWGDYYKRKLREIGYRGVIYTIGNSSKLNKKCEKKMELQNKITYFPATVGGSSISKEGSILLAKDIYTASLPLMGINWHVKFKTDTDRELLKSHLINFTEDFDLIKSIETTDIMIVTTSTVFIDGIMEGKKMIIYNPNHLFHPGHYKHLLGLPGINIVEKFDDLLLTLEQHIKQKTQIDSELPSQIMQFEKYRGIKSTEEMIRAFEMQSIIT
jgi:hypothetical protein